MVKSVKEKLFDIVCSVQGAVIKKENAVEFSREGYKVVLEANDANKTVTANVYVTELEVLVDKWFEEIITIMNEEFNGFTSEFNVYQLVPTGMYTKGGKITDVKILSDELSKENDNAEKEAEVILNEEAKSVSNDDITDEEEDGDDWDPLQSMLGNAGNTFFSYKNKFHGDDAVVLTPEIVVEEQKLKGERDTSDEIIAPTPSDKIMDELTEEVEKLVKNIESIEEELEKAETLDTVEDVNELEEQNEIEENDCDEEEDDDVFELCGYDMNDSSEDLILPDFNDEELLELDEEFVF